MPNGKAMLEAFNKKVILNSREYHSGWGRKFGNKGQMAKKYFKRDKKMVATDIAFSTVKQGASLLPGLGKAGTDGARLLGAAAVALKGGLGVGEEHTGASLLDKKLKKLGENLQQAIQELGQVDSERLEYLKTMKKQELLTRIGELERKKVKYDLIKMPEHAKKLSGRHFKLNEATKKATTLMSKLKGISSDDTPMTRMGEWADYFRALHEVEHYQAKCEESLMLIESMAEGAREYLDKSQAATMALRAKHEPSLQKSFANITKKYPEVRTLGDLEQKVVMMSLEASGLV